jgi:hypothetical protein
MGVPTQLHLEAGGGGGGKVGGHDLGRSPVEGERRDQHPPVPDGDQVGLPGRVLLLQQRHRVGAVGGRRPSSVAVQRRPVPSLLALRLALVHARMWDPRPRCHMAPPRQGAVPPDRIRVHCQQAPAFLLRGRNLGVASHPTLASPTSCCGRATCVPHETDKRGTQRTITVTPTPSPSMSRSSHTLEYEHIPRMCLIGMRSQVQVLAGPPHASTRVTVAAGASAVMRSWS